MNSDDLASRVNRAAASILENERLTADLDDAAAGALLDWGVACAEMIAQSTAGLDDAEAEDTMRTRLSATRRLMRLVSRWVTDRRNLGAATSAELLAQIAEQAAMIHGEDHSPPTRERQNAFMTRHFEFADDPKQLIVALRQLLEASPDGSIAHTGEDNDEEEGKQ